MAVGLETGTTRLDDFNGYVDTMGSASSIFDRFKERYGTVKCMEIQMQLFGRSIDFFKDEDAEWCTGTRGWTSVQASARLLRG
jgi:hypothetical protein